MYDGCHQGMAGNMASCMMAATSMVGNIASGKLAATSVAGNIASNKMAATSMAGNIASGKMAATSIAGNMASGIAFILYKCILDFFVFCILYVNENIFTPQKQFFSPTNF